MIKKIFSIIFYTIAALFVGVYVISEITPNFNMTEFGRLFLLCGSCLFLYFGGLLLSEYKGNNKPMKVNLWIFFILYIILLITLTLLDPMWGRNGIGFINWGSKTFNSYIKNSINIIPFKTMFSYIKNFDSL